MSSYMVQGAEYLMCASISQSVPRQPSAGYAEVAALFCIREIGLGDKYDHCFYCPSFKLDMQSCPEY